MKLAPWMGWLVLISTVAAIGQTRLHQQGTVVRMRMADCPTPAHSVLAALSGVPPVTTRRCPEYTLLTERVVYVVVGKSNEQLMPLAEDLHFRIQKNELVVRIENEKREASFVVIEMMTRATWERDEMRRTAKDGAAERNAGEVARPDPLPQ